MEAQPAADLRQHWTLDPDVVFLNHGSFGACPRVILERQRALQDRMERQPVQFFLRDLPELLDGARERLAAFLGASPTSMALVPNATAGVNGVLRSLDIRPGDELMTTNHEYGASRNALQYVAERAGAKLVVVDVPFPLNGPEDVLNPILDAVTDRTRLVLVDHVTSQTGMIWPLEALIPELRRRGVRSLIDGAHGPGMLDLNLDALQPDYYTGNAHKWICTPKGSAFLYVREEHRPHVRPISISHGASAPVRDRSRYWLEFDWTGTCDPTAWLCLPEAIDFLGSLYPGGWAELRRRNHEQVVEGRRVICEALGVAPPCPAEMLGSLASIALPDGSSEPPSSPMYADPLQDELLGRFGIEVPIVPWPAPPRRWVRISSQAHNRAEEYIALAEALRSLLGR